MCMKYELPFKKAIKVINKDEDEQGEDGGKKGLHAEILWTVASVGPPLPPSATTRFFVDINSWILARSVEICQYTFSLPAKGEEVYKPCASVSYLVSQLIRLFAEIQS